MALPAGQYEPAPNVHTRRLAVINYRRNANYQRAREVDNARVEKFEEKTALRIKEGREKQWVLSSPHSF